MSGHLLIQGDARRIPLANESVQCVVTSPPYWNLRDYGVDGQIGLEETPEEFVAALVRVFREVRRVLRHDGTVWMNLGDSYAGSWGNQGRKEERGTQRPINGEMMQPVHDERYPSVGSNTGKCPPGLKPKDLVGIPWRVAFALQVDGWYLRSDIIWSKPNPMPESVTDRPTKSHEYMFLLTKSERYFYDTEAIKEPASNYTSSTRGPGNWGIKPIGIPGEGDARGRTSGRVGDGSSTRNRRSVWTVATHPFPGAHFATFPPKLIEPCIKAGCPRGGIVFDPFGGACTIAVVAEALGRHAVCLELNPEYLALGKRRLERPHACLAKGDDGVALPLFSGMEV